MSKPAKTGDRLRVLVPIDFSETSRRALAWAFDYATRAPCEVHLCHVVQDHLADFVPSSNARLNEEMAGVA
jgi:nucleotide-binding universal stress UspA family protein